MANVLKDEIAVSGSPRSLEVLHASGTHGRKLVPVKNHVVGKGPVKKPMDVRQRPSYAEIVGKRV